MITRDQVIDLTQAHRSHLEAMGVRSLELFGSADIPQVDKKNIEGLR